MFEDPLFQKNWACFTSAFGSDRVSEIDLDIVKARREASKISSSSQPWSVEKKNFLTLPVLFPRNTIQVDQFKSQNSNYNLGGSIEQYLDVPGDDPHVMQTVLRFRDAVSDVGFDPDFDYSSSSNLTPHFLIAFATGDGTELLKLLKIFKPYRLIISLSDWNDFVSSFWTIDWVEINQSFARDGESLIYIGKQEEPEQLLALMCGISMAGQDHSLLYLPSGESSCHPDSIAKKDYFNTSKQPANNINYLGFTLDEYNMIYDTWKTLSRSPAVYRKPSSSIGGKFIICGSGPSLDHALPYIKELSKDHIIVACASNYGTLRRSNIDVDIFCLLERGSLIYTNDYNPVIQELGKCSAKLVASSTTDSRMHDLFDDSLIYYRPALTPLSIFASDLDQVLNFEGPQTINTGLALAAECNADQVLLVGVDLGARSLDKVRSNDAAGESPREFSLELPGNFGGKIITDQLMNDGRIAAEACLKYHKDLKVMNASDGVLINGASPCTIEDYFSQYKIDTLTSDKLSAFNDWWNTLPTYDLNHFASSWIARRPRSEIFEFFSQMKEYCSQDVSNIFQLFERISKLLEIDTVSIQKQFPRRITRSTYHKLFCIIWRQYLIMNDDADKQKLFLSKALSIMVDLSNSLELELYNLCDSLEAL